MNLDDAELLQLLSLVKEACRRRGAAGQPIGAWLIRLARRLELESAVVSADGHPGQDDGRHLATWLTARETAELLGMSERHVRRIKADLDAECHAKRWFFPRSSVCEYAEWHTAR